MTFNKDKFSDDWRRRRRLKVVTRAAADLVWQLKKGKRGKDF